MSKDNLSNIADLFPGGDQKSQYAISFGKGKPHWPKNVKSISIDALDYLGFDGKNLYWDGKKLQVAKTITLSFWQKLSGIIVTLSALALPLIEIYKILEHKP